MAAKVFKDVADVIGTYTGLSRTVLDFVLLMKSIVDNSKQPGFSVESWAPTAKYIAVEEFERIGNFKEVMTYPQYVDFLTKWAASSDWECSFKRITENDNVVILELEERNTTGDQTNIVNSVSIYEFNAKGKVSHLDIYLQMKPIAPEMLAAYS